MARGDTAWPRVEHRVAVQRGLIRLLKVDDPRADLERLDVRGPECAEAADEAREPSAILGRVERLRRSERSVLRRRSGDEKDESGERTKPGRNDENARRLSRSADH